MKSTSCAPEDLQDRVAAAGARHGFSAAATQALWHAVTTGHGAMAQYSHPELGGPGQWMRGGMTMVGDMFNHALAARVAAACEDLAGLLAALPDGDQADPVVRPGSWWPSAWGMPAAGGAQNNLSYAWFPQERRLAVKEGDSVAVYDTGEHVIQGVSQQQGDAHSLAFVSQLGVVNLGELKAVGTGQASTHEARPADAPVDDPTELLGQLVALHKYGLLSDEDFRSRKAEVLARI